MMKFKCAMDLVTHQGMQVLELLLQLRKVDISSDFIWELLS